VGIKQNHPFIIDAIVILPDHLHTLWQLPENDADYPMRWRLIKSAFSRALPQTEGISTSRRKKAERGIWQRRYWEHLIRDEIDFKRHVDYIHYNPVKHGYTQSPVDWPYSSIHRYIQKEIIQSDWVVNGDFEGCFGEG
jgi:putative transposase